MQSSMGVAPIGGETTPDLDPAYVVRRDEIAALAAGPYAEPAPIDYTDDEHRTWKHAVAALADRWAAAAVPEILSASRRLDLPVDRLPQLTEITAALRPRTGFVYRAVPGLVPVNTFFGALANGCFLSTQYVRHHDNPLYTPEPDIIHEVVGHGTCLAQPHLAMLHREAGTAMLRMQRRETRQFLANVFWFSAEFGVVTTADGPRAYGAGLLSSFGELDWFRANAEVRPVDIDAMGTHVYDISRYQPVLFGAESLGHLLDSVGEFFAEATEDSVSSRMERLAAA